MSAYDGCVPGPDLDRRLAARGWHTAPAGRPGSIALSGALFYGDGDGVTVLVRADGDEALASDGGTAVTRLADAGVDIWTPGPAAEAWAAVLDGYKLAEVDGRMVGRRPLGQAEQLVADVAGAMLTADGLRWLAPDGGPGAEAAGHPAYASG